VGSSVIEQESRPDPCIHLHSLGTLGRELRFALVVGLIVALLYVVERVVLR
jgi:hypothetical protein